PVRGRSRRRARFPRGPGRRRLGRHLRSAQVGAFRQESPRASGTSGREGGEPPRRHAGRDPRGLRASRGAAREPGADDGRAPGARGRARTGRARAGGERAGAAAQRLPRTTPRPPALIGSVRRAERDAILRQQVVLPETPRQRRELAALEDELRSSPLRGGKLPLRLRNFAPSAEAYLASTGGPLPYMLRLHEIERQTADHEAALGDAWERVAHECAGDADAFGRRWRAVAVRWSF